MRVEILGYELSLYVNFTLCKLAELEEVLPTANPIGFVHYEPDHSDLYYDIEDDNYIIYKGV